VARLTRDGVGLDEMREFRRGKRLPNGQSHFQDQGSIVGYDRWRVRSCVDRHPGELVYRIRE
jgi:hypothetical protein